MIQLEAARAALPRQLARREDQQFVDFARREMHAASYACDRRESKEPATLRFCGGGFESNTNVAARSGRVVPRGRR
jgi:hypothetical protein